MTQVRDVGISPPPPVGRGVEPALLSVNALREDLQVSHKTAERWIAILERLYAIFRVPPLGAPRIRAIRKARKHYHFDGTVVDDDAARFENLVAAHLLPAGIRVAPASRLLRTLV